MQFWRPFRAIFVKRPQICDRCGKTINKKNSFRKSNLLQNNLQDTCNAIVTSPCKGDRSKAEKNGSMFGNDKEILKNSPETNFSLQISKRQVEFGYDKPAEDFSTNSRNVPLNNRNWSKRTIFFGSKAFSSECRLQFWQPS